MNILSKTQNNLKILSEFFRVLLEIFMYSGVLEPMFVIKLDSKQQLRLGKALKAIFYKHLPRL